MLQVLLALVLSVNLAPNEFSTQDGYRLYFLTETNVIEQVNAMEHTEGQYTHGIVLSPVMIANKRQAYDLIKAHDHYTIHPDGNITFSFDGGFVEVGDE